MSDCGRRHGVARTRPILLSIVLLLTGWLSASPGGAAPGLAAPGAAAAPVWLEVASVTVPAWVAPLTAHPARVVVISEETLDRDWIAAVHAAGKQVYARISVGRVRPSHPAWTVLDGKALGFEPAPGASGTWLVRYDRPQWREIMERTAARCALTGCDGIVLTDAEALRDFPEWTTVRLQLRDLIERMAEALQRHRPGAVVWLDGSADLLDDRELRPTVHGLIVSELWYAARRVRRQPDRASRDRLVRLRQLQSAGFMVGVREIPHFDNQRAVVERLAAREGFVIVRSWP